jgi:hypothetical protein
MRVCVFCASSERADDAQRDLAARVGRSIAERGHRLVHGGTRQGLMAVVAAAAWRRVQSEFVTRGEAAIERWKQEGGGYRVDEVMADLQARLDDAKRRAAQRTGR